MVLFQLGKLIFWIGIGFVIPAIATGIESILNITFPNVSILIFQISAMLFAFANSLKIIYIIHKWVNGNE